MLVKETSNLIMAIFVTLATNQISCLPLSFLLYVWLFSD